MRPTILLYDIDGTLISSSGAGRRAMEKAFEARWGRRDVLDFPFDGMTDHAIVRQALLRAGAPDDEPQLAAAVEALLASYLETLRAEVELSRDFRIHEGVERALGLTEGRPGFAVGLGTGNVRAGAAIKLGRVGLFDRFEFGGFGCDHVDRPALLAVGARRGADLLGVPREACRVVVIGDTPKDVTAAHAIEAECIAVTTGSFGADALRAHAPAFVFASLASEGADAALLGDARI